MEQTSLSILLRARGMRLIDLARIAAVDKATVTRWSKNKIPAERIVDIERITGISRQELRPDLFRSFLTQDGNRIPRASAAEDAA